jgi:hypothetical protein
LVINPAVGRSSATPERIVRSFGLRLDRAASRGVEVDSATHRRISSMFPVLKEHCSVAFHKLEYMDNASKCYGLGTMEFNKISVQPEASAVTVAKRKERPNRSFRLPAPAARASPSLISDGPRLGISYHFSDV